MNLKEIEQRYAATLNGFSSNPGVYYESSKDVPELITMLRETREALINLVERIHEFKSEHDYEIWWDYSSAFVRAQKLLENIDDSLSSG